MTAPTHSPDREYRWLAIDAELPDGWNEGAGACYETLHRYRRSDSGLKRPIWREIEHE